MKITLKLSKEKKEFTVGYINMLAVRRAMEIQEEIEDFKNPSCKQLDKIVDFIVETFDKQFTREDFYRGFAAKGFVNNTIEILNQITELLIKAADDLGE